MAKRLYRIESEKMLAGVAAGLGRYFDIDPTWVRLLFVALVIGGGSGIVIYIILWIALPAMPYDVWQNEFNFSPFEKDKKSNTYNYQTYAQTPYTEPQTVEPEIIEQKVQEPTYKSKDAKNMKSQYLSGLILVAIGILFLLQNFDIIRFRQYWPILLIVAGAGLLLNDGFKKVKKDDYEK